MCQILKMFRYPSNKCLRYSILQKGSGKLRFNDLINPTINSLSGGRFEQRATLMKKIKC